MPLVNIVVMCHANEEAHRVARRVIEDVAGEVKKARPGMLGHYYVAKKFNRVEEASPMARKMIDEAGGKIINIQLEKSVENKRWPKWR